jgi:hypothetical protein
MRPVRRFRSRACSLLVVLSFVVPIVLSVPRSVPSASAAAGFPGQSDNCEVNPLTLIADLSLVVGPLGGVILGLVADRFLNELGWAWVDPLHPMQSLTGVVENKSDVSPNDLPAEHDSHDQNFDVVPDPSSQFLMSDANLLDHGGTMENEWEVNDFPEWAWPNIGDRVWLNGNWVLDCSHNEPISGHHNAEIHPPRAVASMRDEMHTLPGSGTTPVALKGTDLYIHGNGGYATTVEECGVSTVLFLDNSPCTPRPGIAEDYNFEIPIGAAPFPGAVPSYSVEVGPGNTLAPAPTLTFESVSALTGGPAYLVHVPLAGTGATNDDVYARHIYTGWIAPPANLHHYVATLVKGHIDNAHSPVPFTGCDCRSFRMSVNRATNSEWSTLNGFDVPTDISGDPFCPGSNTLDSWRDGGICGSGDLNFNGPSFDFYLHDQEFVTFHFYGYKSNCWDSAFGSPHSLEVSGLIMGLCYLTPSVLLGDGPEDSDLGVAEATFIPSSILANNGDHVVHSQSGDYNMTVHVDEVPLGLEDTADLALNKNCSPAQVIAPAPFSCRIEVTNAGPALPHDVKVTDTITAPTTNYTVVNPTLSWENVASPPPPVPCTVTANQIVCNVGTVPLDGAKAVINYDLTSNDGGTFSDTATVTTGSTDNNSANDSATASAMVIVPTRTAIASSADPSRVSQAVTYTATVTAGVGTSTPTGTTTFYDGAAPVTGCAGVTLVAGHSTCTVTYTATGNHHMSVAYSGATAFLPSTSPPLGQTVTKCSQLAGCNLSGADLTNAQLAGANLKGANLLNATLAGANLNGANLNGANLNSANLTGANLTGANLTGANLNSANLTGANLQSALDKGANFNKVVWSQTTCPDGTNSTADGGTCSAHL